MLSCDKNIVLITVECLRADHMHYLGYSKEITPTLDKLSKLGMCFSRAMVTCPWTPASFKSIFSSRYPLMEGGMLSITKNMGSLPRLLKSKGYKTSAVIPPGWSQLLLHEENFDKFYASDRIKRGTVKLIRLNKFFERIKTSNSSLKRKKRKVKTRGGESFTLSDIFSYLENFKQILPPFANYYTAKVNSWIEENQDEKFFLWTHYPDPHEPYDPVSPFLSLLSFLKNKRINEKSTKNHSKRFPGKLDLSSEEVKLLIDLYDKRVEIVDRAINGIIKKLTESDILNDTYIIITGDHGQEFMDHGEYGHGLHLYNEVINVPLLILGPKIRKEKIDKPVSLIDIAPTILDLLDLKQNKDFLGISLLDTKKREKKATLGIICEEGRKKRNDHFLEGGKLRVRIRERKVALITSAWKYIYKENQGDELYNLRKDPKEKENLYAEKPQIAYRLKKRIQNHIKYEKKQSRQWKFGKKIKRIKRKINTS